MDEHFDAEVDASVVEPLARVMVTLFEESRAGVTTGTRHVLTRGGTLALEDVLASPPPVAAEPPARPQGMEDVAPSSAESTDAATAPGPATTAPATTTPSAPTEDDGWETVPVKPKRRGPKN